MDEIESFPGDHVDARWTRLSARQRQCLQGVLALKPAKRIAHDLGITPSAVEKHLRQAREKLGVASTAEAAQIFASLRGAEFPHCGISDLVRFDDGDERRRVLQSPDSERLDRLEDTHKGVLSIDYTLTPLQTMISIFALSFVSIVGLLLLISCARAVESIVRDRKSSTDYGASNVERSPFLCPSYRCRTLLARA